MKNFIKLMMVVLVAMCGFTACEKECDHDFMDENVDYSKSVIGCWDISGNETISELLELCADGTFNTLGEKNGEIFVEEGTWTLSKNRLVLTTDEGKIHFSGTITVYPEDVMLMTADGSKEPLVYHYWVQLPFPKSLVGTWTCLDADFAEVLTIRESSMMTITRLQGDSLIEDMPGQFLDSNGDDSYGIAFGDGTYRWGYYEVVSGELLVLTDLAANTRRLYHYCKEDLSEEIVGMWVCNETPSAEENDMLIMNFNEDGTSSFTGYFYGLDDFGANKETSYKVIGDLIIHKQPDIAVEYGFDQYTVMRMIYSPNGTSLGDIMSLKAYAKVGENSVESTTSWLRIKQSLDLEGQKYNYIKTYVSNVKGEDKDIEFMGLNFNFAKMNGSELDNLLKAILFKVEFPNADTLHYTYQYNNVKEVLKAPIVVEGNKMTIKMSEKVSTLKDVVLYAFQDADCSQMHFYMHREAFVNFHTNMQAMLIESTDEQFDITNEASVNAIYDNISNAVETINVSLVMKK